MSCVLIIGDTHYKTKNVVETTEFEQKLFEFLGRQTEPLSYIVCTGDMLNDHETIHSDPLRRVISLIHRLRRYATVYVIVGNHDRPNNSNFLTEEHPFTAMKHWHDDIANGGHNHPVKVVDTVLVEQIDSHQFIFVPYVPPGRFFDALATVVDEACLDFGPDPKTSVKRDVNWWRQTLDPLMSNTSALFTHQEFYGVPLSKDTVSVNGDRWPLDYPVVFNGHIHDFSHPQANIYNVGTPFQQTFGENPDKTISIVTIGSKNDSGQATIDFRRVDLGLTKKVTVELSINDLVTYQPPTGVHLKVVVVGDSAELKQASKLHQVKALIDQDVKVVYKDSGETHTRNRRTPPRITIGEHGLQSNVSFARRLHQRVSGDPALASLFTELFGAPTVSPLNNRLRLRVVEPVG